MYKYFEDRMSVAPASGKAAYHNAMVGGSSVDFMRYGVGSDAEIGVIFNEGSIDADFRGESNGSTHAIFVDGGNDRVGIGNQ